LSLPRPPLIVVVSLSVKTPLVSSMVTASSPPRASTRMRSNRLRSTLASTVPSPPASI
jgi:hypothetical protein